jgi:hypothetical protein
MSAPTPTVSVAKPNIEMPKVEEGEVVSVESDFSEKYAFELENAKPFSEDEKLTIGQQSPSNWLVLEVNKDKLIFKFIPSGACFVGTRKEWIGFITK